MKRTYESIDEFYEELSPQSRRYSPEWDYGVHWVDDLLTRSTSYRVSWVINTGELYALEHRTGKLEVLGIVPAVGAYPAAGEGRKWTEWKDKQPVEALMSGYADEPRSLRWIRDRLEQVGQ